MLDYHTHNYVIYLWNRIVVDIAVMAVKRLAIIHLTSLRWWKGGKFGRVYQDGINDRLSGNRIVLCCFEKWIFFRFYNTIPGYALL